MPKNTDTINEPIDAVVFDCDGTLSSIEGIDVLAEYNGVDDDVKAMTAKAMGETGLTLELYNKRLELVKPTQAQLIKLTQDYIQHMTPDADSVITKLTDLNKAIYIISAGLAPSVQGLGRHLQVPTENIFAVDIVFDHDGNYLAFDTSSPLTTGNGKRDILTHIKNQHQKIAYIGDGLNDLAIKDMVDRFIGYGGAFYRPNIEKACEYYLKDESLAHLLPLVLTQNELESIKL